MPMRMRWPRQAHYPPCARHCHSAPASAMQRFVQESIQKHHAHHESLTASNMQHKMEGHHHSPHQAWCCAARIGGVRSCDRPFKLLRVERQPSRGHIYMVGMMLCLSPRLLRRPWAGGHKIVWPYQALGRCDSVVVVGVLRNERDGNVRRYIDKWRRGQAWQADTTGAGLAVMARLDQCRPTRSAGAAVATVDSGMADTMAPGLRWRAGGAT